MVREHPGNAQEPAAMLSHRFVLALGEPGADLLAKGVDTVRRGWIGWTLESEAVQSVAGPTARNSRWGSPSWINDPGRDLVAIVMSQSSDFLFSGALEEFWRGVYEAIG